MHILTHTLTHLARDAEVHNVAHARGVCGVFATREVVVVLGALVER